MKEIYALSRYCLAFIFIYHGLVPKLWFKNSQEILMNETMLPFVSESMALMVSGWSEVIIGLLFILLYKTIFLNYLAILFVSGVSIAILFSLPHLYTNAFNPFSLNLSVIALAVINIHSRELSTNQ